MAIYLERDNKLKCINNHCNGGFVIRRNIEDDNYFLGCSKYPKCNKTISVNYFEASSLGIYRDDIEMDMIYNLSENEVLNDGACSKNLVDFRKEYSSDSKKRSLIFSNEVPLFAIFT